MNRFYKPYLYGILTVASILSVIMLFKYELEVSLLVGLIILFGAILEVVLLHYAQNKGASLQAPLMVFAVINFNPTTCVAIVLTTYILQNLIYKIIDMESVFNMSVKILFNLSSRILSILASCLVVAYFPNNMEVVKLIVVTSAYVLTNFSTVAMIIYLATNDLSKTVNDPREILSYLYVSIIILLMLVYGFKAYELYSILLIMMFLIPFQASVLSGATEKSVINSIYIDALTKLYNRASLNKILIDYITNQTPFTIIFLDFNRFKRINDNYGHDVGDQVLIHFANSVKEHLRKQDKVYRFGGDEFAMVVAAEYDVEAIVEKLSSIKDTLVLEYAGYTIPYSFSIGTYNYTGENGQTLEHIISQASHKMEEDKAKMHAADGLEGTYVDSRLI